MKIVSVVTGSLAAISRRFEVILKEIGSRLTNVLVQKTVLLGARGSFKESSVPKVTC